MSFKIFKRSRALKPIAALILLAALSGCYVGPGYGPGYYNSYSYGYYGPYYQTYGFYGAYGYGGCCYGGYGHGYDHGYDRGGDHDRGQGGPGFHGPEHGNSPQFDGAQPGAHLGGRPGGSGNGAPDGFIGAHDGGGSFNSGGHGGNGNK